MYEQSIKAPGDTKDDVSPAFDSVDALLADDMVQHLMRIDRVEESDFRTLLNSVRKYIRKA